MSCLREFVFHTAIFTQGAAGALETGPERSAYANTPSGQWFTPGRLNHNAVIADKNKIHGPRRPIQAGSPDAAPK